MRPRTSRLSQSESRRAPPPELTRNSILRISDAKTIQLIQEWEKLECLWNTNLPNYPNKQERNQAIALIAEKLDIPNFMPEHVSMKFKNLRNSYCQELRKMATDQTYKPKVFWFAHMDRYIRPHLQKINTYMDSSKVVHKEDKSTYEVKTEIDSGEENEDWTVENTTQSEASCSNSIRIESAYSEKSQSEYGENSNQSQAKQLKKRKLSRDRRSFSVNGEHSEALQATNGENRAKVARKMVKLLPTVRKTDHCDTFGNYIASLLRTLPRKKALMLQPKIVELIVSVGLEGLSEDDDGDESDS